MYDQLEYLEVTIESNNNLVANGSLTTIQALGDAGWEMTCILPNVQYRQEQRVIELPGSLYFYQGRVSDRDNTRVDIVQVPYHVAIFKRRKWQEL